MNFPSTGAFAAFLALLLGALSAASPIDPVGASIVPGPRLNGVLASHTATVLDDGSVLIAGGLSSTTPASATSSVEIYQPHSRQLMSAEPMRVARCGATATRLRDGTVLVAGGWTPRGITNEAEIYRPNEHHFVRIRPMRVARAGHTATLLGDGRVLIIGGNTSDEDVTASAEIFDPRTSSFAAVSRLKQARSEHVAAVLHNGHVLIAGGENGNQDVNSAEEFDPQTERFSPVGNLASARAKAAAVTLQDGTVLIIGGQSAGPQGAALQTSERFDPRTRRFHPDATMHEARYKIDGSVVLLTNGDVLVTGGSKRAEMYDAAQKRFMIVRGSLGIDRHFATASLLKDGSVFIAGGYSMLTHPPISTDSTLTLKLQ